MKNGIKIIQYTGNKKYDIKFPTCLENNVTTSGEITVKRISKPIKHTKALKTLDSRLPSTENLMNLLSITLESNIPVENPAFLNESNAIFVGSTINFPALS